LLHLAGQLLIKSCDARNHKHKITQLINDLLSIDKIYAGCFLDTLSESAGAYSAKHRYHFACDEQLECVLFQP